MHPLRRRRLRRRQRRLHARHRGRYRRQEHQDVEPAPRLPDRSDVRRRRDPQLAARRPRPCPDAGRRRLYRNRRQPDQGPRGGRRRGARRCPHRHPAAGREKQREGRRGVRRRPGQYSPARDRRRGCRRLCPRPLRLFGARQGQPRVAGAAPDGDQRRPRDRVRRLRRKRRPSVPARVARRAQGAVRALPPTVRGRGRWSIRATTSMSTGSPASANIIARSARPMRPNAASSIISIPSSASYRRR